MTISKREEAERDLKFLAQHYGTPSDVRQEWIKKLLSCSNDEFERAHAYLTGAAALLRSSSDTSDPRNFCRDCRRFGQDLKCDKAVKGQMGDGLHRYQPDPFIPRTCPEFSRSLSWDVSVPAPCYRIAGAEARIEQAFELGFHPHDKRWLLEKIESMGETQSERDDLLRQYQEWFRSAYRDPTCPAAGQEGFARRHANKKLLDEWKIIMEKKGPMMDQDDEFMGISGP